MERNAAGETMFSELQQRSESEVAQVLADARAEAVRARAAAEAHLAQRREEAMAACAAALTPRRTSALREARRSAERTLLEAQRASIGRIAAALREIAAGPCAPDGKEVATRLEALLAYVSDGERVELRARPEITAMLGGLTGGRNVQLTADPTLSPGIVLTVGDGVLVVEDTVDAWLSANEAELAIDICGLVETAETAS